MKFLLIMVLLSAFTAVLLYLGGIRVLNTYGTSMYPGLETGDVIVIYPKNPSEIGVGEIVTYRKNIEGRTYLITHRVVGKTKDGFVTKGDNLLRQDEPISVEDVVGVYWGKIPKVGLLGSFVRTFWGYLFLILIPGVSLILMEIRSILGDAR